MEAALLPVVVSYVVTRTTFDAPVPGGASRRMIGSALPAEKQDMWSDIVPVFGLRREARSVSAADVTAIG